MTMAQPLDERVTATSVIIDEMKRKTPQLGPNTSWWPGLTLYRFTSPQTSQWEKVAPLALCLIAQGRKAVRANAIEFQYDPCNYFVVNDGMRFEAEVLEASDKKPFLSLVLQIDPLIVRRVTAEMHDSLPSTSRSPSPSTRRSVLDAYVSPVEPHLTDAILRFLRALDTPADRRILAPIFLEEIVYRLLQAEQGQRLIELAAKDIDANGVRAAVDYVRENPNKPLSVNELAERVYMSPSAFAHRFRESIGISPYQFVKNVRLESARTLLLQDRMSVREAASRAGYTSPSHFINEFKRRFGVTPRRYADLQMRTAPTDVGARTTMPRGRTPA